MAGTVVETRYGKVEGAEERSVLSWKGVPYARPALGTLRFRPPQPPEPWSGVRPAQEFGPICPQPMRPAGGILPRFEYPQDEDCLTLNVWSPAADSARRPVMVWIHGGGFTSGSGRSPTNNGASFAARGDLVVVTFNYRLGLLGFLHLADMGGEAYAASGNCGILDQIAALTWLRDNIAAFGGDPRRVTVFGESAGAMSVGTLLATPAAQGLFQRAILESGAAHNALPRETATATAERALAELGIARDNLGALADVPVARLLEVQTRLGQSAGGMVCQPVIDGVVLPERPIDAIAHGSAAGVATLIGTNRNENKLFSAMAPGDDEARERRAAAQLGAHADRLLQGYRAANPNAATADIVDDILTDRTFRIPAIRLAEQQAAHGAPVWMYRFDWQSPVRDGRLGAAHALEMPFVFNSINDGAYGDLTGTGPERQTLADRMHDAWIAFARSGDPSTPALPAWPQYDNQRRATMVFDNICRLEDDPQAAERKLWEGIL